MKTVLLLFAGLILVSCGEKTHHSPSTAVTQDTVKNEEVEIFRVLPLTQLETVSFVRKEKMTSIYDCKGNLTFRGLKTQNSLTKKLVIDFDDARDSWSYTVMNRRTKDSKTGFGSVQSREGHSKFYTPGRIVIDYAPTVFNMHVKEGTNDIEYTFYRCPKKSRRGDKCEEELEVAFEGILQVEVEYSTEVVPGENFIHPTSEGCSRPPKVFIKSGDPK